MTENIRILRITSRYIVGGPAQHVTQLADLGSGFESVLAAGAPEAGEDDLVERARARGLNVVRIPELGRSIRPARDMRAIHAVIRLIRDFRPHIVDTHTAKAGAAGRIAAALTRVPVRVHTFHGHVFDGYFDPSRTRRYIAAERALAHLTTRIIALSEQQRADLVERYRIAGADRVRVIPLGLDLEPFRNAARFVGAGRPFRTELGAQGDLPVITIVGRLAPIKRHDIFLHATRIYVERYGAANFAIIGGGELEQQLRAHAGDNVHFLGFRNDLENIYAGSDIVTLCSDNEGTPVSLIEALAAESNVVATDVGGVADVLQHGERGYLVPPRDPEALAQAWHMAASADANVVRRKQIADDVQREYGAERLRTDMRAFYTQLVEGAK